ncbi:hypothetical protein [Neptuniibacter sp. UBA847]|uniref:hypothetical protein n=1 Tax=Neptuniibacter sp. UBA847 TaxID=1946977 RepID=UPI000C558F55|nr:hypothetical protein [Neptuniibacter sp. UBA847]MAY42270.1 hypothetical protein [Oceanospirillaceae bacterium]|tara:strand:+ start:6302 stop:6751 length:450 start_codon:yes stop_codon:yes gene_type:complete
MQRINQHEFLMQVLRGNADAVEMCEQIFQVSQVIDDLVDQDKPITSAEVIKTFWVALIELPANPFYRRHELVIRPLMAGALQDWTDSVSLEREGDVHGKHLAFVLRDQLTSLVIQCAYLVGGYKWMQEIGVPVRRYFHDEGLIEYINNL